jgi:DNA-binding NarL/FixJ family response regulator
MPARLEHAYSLVELGAALRRANRRPAARDRLWVGIELAQQCGAERLEERAMAELRDAGARPRRRATTGVEALTARERRIAELAAAGRSTQEIAEELVVAAKTVETHLSHIYAKLGIAGLGARGRLTEALKV